MFDLSKKKVLIIDDFAEFRYTLKKMLQSLNCDDVDDVGDGDTAIDRIALKHYDIILCDYNLGEGRKDGQQVLEEVKHRRLMKYSTIYIMVTAENAMFMVMGVLEYKPDDYLTKPFTKEILQSRLERITEKKKDFEEIDRAIQRDEYITAIQLCNKKILDKPKNLIEFYRLKGELCLLIGEYDKAEEVFDTVIEMRSIPWAMLGKGKVQFYKGNYRVAKDIFKSLTEENIVLLDAYDWLAKAYSEMALYSEAQNVLIKATDYSPRAILRQKALAEVAFKNKDYDMAEKAYKSTVELGKLSCFKNQSDYIGLAKVLLNKFSHDKALAVLKEAKTAFSDDNKAVLQAAVMEGIINKEIGRSEASKKAIEEASIIFSGIEGKVDADIAMDMARAFFMLGDKEQGVTIMKGIIQNHHDDEKVLKLVQEVFNEANLKIEGAEFIASSRREIIHINNEGVRLVQEGKLKEAIEFFEKAARGLPDNKIINANAAQALLMYMQKVAINERYLFQAKRYLDNIKNVDPSYKKYRNLLPVYEKMKRDISK
ncbi:MAG: response regulator [Candidatus Magnetoovum sp. WYHC-5]|nr:response regulator [Candidatus Magnetoovum sp. WYHC-5]